MLHLKSVNHSAIIASDYNCSRSFYTQVLGMEVIGEEYRAERNSMMGRLALNGEYLVELFSFAGSPPRPSYPEACGLRHLAFTDLDGALKLGLEMTLSLLKQQGREISPESQQAIAWLERK